VEAVYQSSSQVTDSQISQTDTSYQPSQQSQSQDSDTTEGLDLDYSDRKFLVYERHLDELFTHCSVCSHSCRLIKRVIGTYVSVTQSCLSCNFTRCWTSQPMIGSLPAGNIHLSAALFFSGASISKAERVMAALNVEGISSATFYRHSQLYLQPTVLSLWHTHQLELIHQLVLRSGEVVVGGDMRADSPGHCAKYGSYTMLEVRSNRITDVQLVQSNEVGGSGRMEKEGLIRSLEFLESSGLSVDAIITDRHPQVQKYLRENKPSISHYYDVWHVAKGLSKKLESLGKERQCEAVREWAKSIVNHLYWSVASSSTGEEAVAKWVSVANHVQNVHQHDDWLFPACAHGDLDSDHRTKWLEPCTKACERLADIVTRKQLLADVAKLSRHQQTSAVEGFHSLILKFAPKNLIFSYRSMLCRLYLAALHFNENADRSQRVNAAGEPIFSLRFPKFKKGGYSVMPVKDAPTYKYVDELLQLLFTSVLQDPAHYHQLNTDIIVPPALCSDFQRPTLSALAVQSRFNRSSEP